MAKTKAPIPIPFKKDGSLLSYSSLKYPNVTLQSSTYQPWDAPDFWKDNFIFQDTLTYAGISSGRSAVNPYFKSEVTGARYQTFVSEFNLMVPQMIHGKINGNFTFTKRGANYGLVFVPECVIKSEITNGG